MPTSSMHCPTCSGEICKLTPSEARTSAEPLELETLRFPCLATETPAPAATIAVAVLMLKV